MWLRSAARSKKKQTTVPMSLPTSIKSACRANETCDSFSECVCDANCAVKAIAEANPSCQDPEKVFAYFQSVSKNPTDWLAASAQSVAQPNKNKNLDHWLKQDAESSASVPRNAGCEFAYFQSVSATTSDWLQQQQQRSDDNINSVDATIAPTHDTFVHSDKITKWLREVSTTEEKEEAMQECAGSEGCKDDEENEKWLHQSGSNHGNVDGEEDQSGWKVVEKYHAQLSHSDWLQLQMQPSSDKCDWLMDSSALSSTMSSPSPSVGNIEAYKLFLRLANDECDANKWLKQ